MTATARTRPASRAPRPAAPGRPRAARRPGRARTPRPSGRASPGRRADGRGAAGRGPGRPGHPRRAGRRRRARRTGRPRAAARGTAAGAGRAAPRSTARRGPRAAAARRAARRPAAAVGGSASVALGRGPLELRDVDLDVRLREQRDRSLRDHDAGVLAQGGAGVVGGGVQPGAAGVERARPATARRSPARGGAGATAGARAASRAGWPTGGASRGQARSGRRRRPRTARAAAPGRASPSPRRCGRGRTERSYPTTRDGFRQEVFAAASAMTARRSTRGGSSSRSGPSPSRMLPARGTAGRRPS